jgi:membrane protease YdiL (CAAX protease family)
MIRHLLGERLRFDRNVAVVTIISTLLLIVDAYFRITPSKTYDRLLLYLLIPLLVVLVVLRGRPAEYGFGLGDWRAGLALTGLGVLLSAPLIWFAARQPAMQAYYASQLTGVPWTTFLELIGWEFFFRGFLLWTYVRRFGPDGIWLQAVPFALAHIGKPSLETLSTIFGGFAFGWLGYRTRSFLYPFFLHWFIDSFAILVASGALG